MAALETGLPSFDTVLLNCQTVIAFLRGAGVCAITNWL